MLACTMRTPQKTELLSIDEITAIKKQLRDAITICEDCESLMREKGITSLPVLFKPSFIRAMDAVRRMQESIYKSVMAVRLGRELVVSSRAKRIAKAAESKLKKSRKSME